MHIPDGYLSPQTYIPFYIAFISILGVALRKVKKTLSVKLIPFLGMSAAFSFLIMMFNIPIPGGTSGHAVGAALISILFGPWIAMISISVALIIQTFVFGDGGITALGANCFNMAVVMPFIAYGIFRFLNNQSQNIKRMQIAAFFSGYISLCVTAAITAIEFGIQPLIAHAPNGMALYAPYPLKYALPGMLIGHLAVFGVAEGLITALLFRYFYNTNKELVEGIK